MYVTLLPAALLLILAAKAVFLAGVVLPERVVAGALYALSADAPVISGFILLELLISWMRLGGTGWVPFRFLLRLSAYAVFILFALHAAAIIAIDEIITVDSIKKFGAEWKAALEFVQIRHVAAVLAVAFGTLLRIRTSVKGEVVSAAAATILAGVSFLGAARIPEPFLGYRFRPLEIVRPIQTARKIGSADREWYSSEDIEYFEKSASLIPDIELPEGSPNILLLVVESLSAVDSFRLTGFKNTLPNFDRISRDGLLFSRFFSNTRQSEGAQIAIFSGHCPIPFPGSSSDWYGSFASLHPVIPVLKKAGYHLESLSVFESGFLRNGPYVQGLGFDRVRGRDETAAFAKAPRFAFGTPSDAVMYGEVLRTLEELGRSDRPFLFTVYTGSSHLPWTAPQGGPNTEKRVWEYVDAQLGRFYDSLRQTSFFDNGILIVLGDHRKRVPRSIEEERKLGEMSRALVPLLIVGKDFPAGKIDDRFFQQADLLTKLGAINRSSEVLSPFIFFLDDPPESFLFFDASEGGQGAHRFHLPSNGSVITWDGTPPKSASVAEKIIHSERALNQARLRAEKTKAIAGL